MVLEVKSDKANIDVKSFEDILYRLNLVLPTLTTTGKKERKVHINISGTNFLDPYSIINLCILLKYLKKYSIHTYLSLPHDINVRNYLKRMDFFHRIPSGVELSDRIHSNLYKKSLVPEESDVLLEVTPIQTQRDIDTVMEYTFERIGHILKRSLGYNGRDISAFCTALAETCQNIKDHSEAHGLVAVQKYHSKTNYVIIGVSDLGVGIKRSLSYRYDTSIWNHSRAIQHALQLGISRIPDRGKGLYRVIEITRKYNGTFILRSGSGRVERGRKNLATIVPYFPGTQIYMRLEKSI